jgi:hypothetical protein
MLRLDKSGKTLIRVPRKKLADLGLLERNDIQQMIRHSPDAFFEELGERLKLIGEEIRPTNDVDDRIDLLAIDSQGAAVVVELKRGTHKLHLLQALGYASMVSKWESSRFGDEYSSSTGKSHDAAEEELEDFLDEDAVLNGAQRIILLAEDFEHEVLVTAEWLSEKYSVDVRCYRLAMSAEDHAEFLSCTCIYPPPEVTEHAKHRGIRSGDRPIKWATWDEALSAIENPAVREFYRKELEAGRESYLRRRILRYRTDGIRRLSVIARRKLAYVWEHRRFKDDEKYWKEALGNEAQVQPVRNGNSLRFFLKSKEGFARFADAIEKLPALEIIDDTDASDDEDAAE